MAEVEEKRSRLQEDLQQVIELLRRHETEFEHAQHPEDAPQAAPAAGEPALVALHAKLDAMHPADVAHILEALPLEERLIVWDLVRQDRDGEILLEVSVAVRESLIAHMETDERGAAAAQLDADEIADLAPDLPPEVMDDLFASLSVEEREQLRAAMSYPEDSVGALMDFDLVSVREDVTVEVVLRYLRRRDDMPDHTDQLFVIDRAERLKGLLPVNRLLVTDPDVLVGAINNTKKLVKLTPEQDYQE
jgi:magnesium transporter